MKLITLQEPSSSYACYVQAMDEDSWATRCCASFKYHSAIKHGNIGDIELTDRNVIVESWMLSMKNHLRDELEELRDKLLKHPELR